MKNQKTRSSSLFLAIIALPFVIAPLRGYAQGDEPNSRGTMAYDNFKKALELVVRGTENGDDCQLQVSESTMGLQLSMKYEENITVISVPRDSLIKFETSSLSDGSFNTLYTIPGQGSVEETLADDAYYHTTIKSFVSGQTAHCDIDF